MVTSVVNLNGAEAMPLSKDTSTKKAVKPFVGHVDLGDIVSVRRGCRRVEV